MTAFVLMLYFTMVGGKASEIHAVAGAYNSQSSCSVAQIAIGKRSYAILGGKRYLIRAECKQSSINL